MRLNSTNKYIEIKITNTKLIWEAITLFNKKTFGGNWHSWLRISSQCSNEFSISITFFATWSSPSLILLNYPLIINRIATYISSIDEVLGRSVSLLIDNRRLDCMVDSRCIKIPNHAFYVDIIISCNVTKNNAHVIASLFQEYVVNSGH